MEAVVAEGSLVYGAIRPEEFTMSILGACAVHALKSLETA